jgi:DNA replication protein DnaC
LIADVLARHRADVPVATRPLTAYATADGEHCVSTPDHRPDPRQHATRLGLTHLTETITALVERAENQQMGYLDFVDLLLEEEVGLRESRRFRNALKLSGLPHHKTLDEFDFAFQPDLDGPQGPRPGHPGVHPRQVQRRPPRPPGVGKTMLAVALAVAACQAGFSIYFTTLDDLVRRLRTAEATGRFNRQLQAFLRPAVLVVDEVGYLPWTAPKPTCSSNSSPAATNAAP